jgi:hypothetical protein
MPSKTKPASTKPARDRSGALYVILEPAMLDAMDAWIEALNAGNIGPQWNRTTLVRALVNRGLQEKAPKSEAP